ncbi:MAG: hypothetical protein DRJ47_04745 [Thermoprotei archaeon]|mgnify:CR=1 FL=1|nr:MAG: hypothetical protein DRJ47_04745 [Thermoprotei archaeon]
MPIAGDIVNVIEGLSRLVERKILIIIDEFQFIAESDPSFVSRLQRLIDQKLVSRNIMLVLCGSAVSFFEKNL